MNRTIKIWTSASFLLVLLVLGGCSSAIEAAPTPTPVVPISKEEPAAAQAPAEEDTAAIATEEERVEAVKPAPKQGLVATDPTDVYLATGEPVLVEFFAFW